MLLGLRPRTLRLRLGRRRLRRIRRRRVAGLGYRYTPRGVSYLLHRLGWSPQVPAHRTVERDEQAVERWRTEQWSRVRGRPSSWAHGSSSRTRPART
ncbi:winged helix-turn-helix domain-containing protein [Streptomyces sp. NPDC005435]|uniref:helix-turn-helix domain-containing protein n=1 Tax=Streptomyces sp. NPDC005435 TaxID=3154464 RepID=UPI0034537D5A